MKNTRVYEILRNFILIYLAQWLTPKEDVELPAEIFESSSFLKISYCTTCMGRTFHLKKTYIKNILENSEYPNLEFILINYNSQDDMDEWVASALQEYIDRGIVKYFRTPDPSSFHASKAKNLAHRLATGDVLVNLDADNFLGKNNAFYTNYYFQKYGPDIILRFSKNGFRYFDTCGRIALKKEDFYKIGGYREDMLPFKEQDMDLLKRSKLAGAKTHDIEIVNFLRTIKHGNNLRKSNIKNSHNLKEMRAQNYLKAKENIEKKLFLANVNGFSKFNIYENFCEETRVID